MKKKQLGIILVYLLMSISVTGQGVSWSVDILPRNCHVCKGENLRFSLENERFEVPGLKEGEYVQRISTEYRWKKSGESNYTFSDTFSFTAGGDDGQSVGTFGVTVEGRAVYNIVWTDGDTGVVNSDGPHTFGWTQIGSTNYTVVETEYEWPSTMTSIGVISDLQLMPQQLYNFVNNRIGSLLRGIRISLENVSITCNKRERNCCDSGEVITNGDSEIRGNFTASFYIQGRIFEALTTGCGVPITTNNDFTINIPYISTEVQITYNVDALIDSHPSLTGYVGKKKVLCEPQKECIFGGFTLEANLVPELRIEALACIRNGNNESCYGASIIPIAFSIGFNVDVNFNRECDNAWHVRSTIGGGKLITQINIWGCTFRHEYDIWSGFTLVDL